MKRRAPVLFFLLALAGGLSGAAKPLGNLRELKERENAPPFALSDLEGKKVRLSDFQGRIVFLNFWATWCEPCKEEIPAMEKLYRDLKSDSFVIVGVNVKEGKKPVQKFVRDFTVTFPVLLDTEGEVGLLYGAWGLPTTYIIGKKGEVIARVFGPALWGSKESREYFQSLLRKPA